MVHSCGVVFLVLSGYLIFACCAEPLNSTSASSADSLVNCSGSSRPHPHNISLYEVVSVNGDWQEQTCPPGTVWVQGQCSCMTQATCTHYRPAQNNSAKFEQLVSGQWITRVCNSGVEKLVWNQTSCRCDWDPNKPSPQLNTAVCETSLNITFDSGKAVDHAKESFIELAPSERSVHVSFLVPNVIPNRVAYLRNASIIVWFFAGNTFGKSLKIGFWFKADNGSFALSTFMTLLSNGCNVTGLDFIHPTVYLGYRPQNSTFKVVLHAGYGKVAYCQISSNALDWHRATLIFQKGKVIFDVDGKKCLQETYVSDIKTSKCPLAFGGHSTGETSPYLGYMDQIEVWRNCNFSE